MVLLSKKLVCSESAKAVLRNCNFNIDWMSEKLQEPKRYYDMEALHRDLDLNMAIKKELEAYLAEGNMEETRLNEILKPLRKRISGEICIACHAVKRDVIELGYNFEEGEVFLCLDCFRKVKDLVEEGG